MIYLGDFPVNHTSVIIPVNTFSSDDPSASCTVTDLAATDVHIHKDGGTTQRNSATASGVTVSIDFDSVTGNHQIVIDLSDNDDAGFYAAGHEYTVRIEGVTIDGATVNAWVGAFSIERAGGVLAYLKAGSTVAASVTAGVTLADDAITAAKFDESTAFPMKAADTGATAVARTGADSDTLETLSDQIDDVQARLPDALTAGGNIKSDTLAINGTTLTGNGGATPWGPA